MPQAFNPVKPWILIHILAKLPFPSRIFCSPALAHEVVYAAAGEDLGAVAPFVLLGVQVGVVADIKAVYPFLTIDISSPKWRF